MISVLFAFLIGGFYFYTNLSGFNEEPENNISSFHIDGKEFVLPSPLHSFLFLHQLGFDWTGLGGLGAGHDYDLPYQKAIQLGMRASNGVVFLFTKELEDAKLARDDVLALANSLDIEDEIRLSVLNLDTAFIKGSGLDEIQEAVTGLEITLENSLRNKGRDDLSVAIELGSWVEGLRMATAGMKKSSTKEQLEVLRQPHVTELSTKIVQKLIERAENPREKEFLEIFLSYLQRIHNQIHRFRNSEITPADIENLYDIAEELQSFLDKKY